MEKHTEPFIIADTDIELVDIEDLRDVFGGSTGGGTDEPKPKPPTSTLGCTQWY